MLKHSSSFLAANIPCSHSHLTFDLDNAFWYCNAGSDLILLRLATSEEGDEDTI
jgi:hypothetical protein